MSRLKTTDPNACKVNHKRVLNLLRVFRLEADFLYLLPEVPGGHKSYQLRKHLSAGRRIILWPIIYVQ